MRANYYTLKDGTKIYSIEIDAYINENNKWNPDKKIWLGFCNGIVIIRAVKDDEELFRFGLIKDYNNFKDSILCK